MAIGSIMYYVNVFIEHANWHILVQNLQISHYLVHEKIVHSHLDYTTNKIILKNAFF